MTTFSKKDLEVIVDLIEEAAGLVEELSLYCDHVCMWHCDYNCDFQEAIFHLDMAKTAIWELRRGR